MIINVNRTLLGWRALLRLIVIVLKVVQHDPIRPGSFAFDFLRKVLFFSLAFPLAFGLVLTRLTKIVRKPTDVEDTLTDQARGKHRVLIVENQLLFGAGLQNILTNKTDIAVTGISPSDQAELVREIRRIQPDVVMLDAASRLVDSAELLALLGNDPTVRVLAFNANNHLVRIHTNQGVAEVPVESMPELVDIISDR